MYTYQMRTQKDIERSITHPDVEKEMWYYSKRKMLLDGRGGTRIVLQGGEEHLVARAREMGISPLAIWSKQIKATIFTGIPAELLYHDMGVANTSVAGTASEVSMNLANPFGQQAYLPAGFWMPGGNIGRFAKVVLRGTATTAASAGTAIFTNRLSTTAFNGASGTVIAGITPTVCAATPVAQTTGMWEQELDIELQSYGTTSAQAIVRGLGKMGFPGYSSTAPWTAQMLNWVAMMGGAANNGTGLSSANLDITGNNYIACNQNCTAATIPSGLQLLQMFVYGMG